MKRQTAYFTYIVRSERSLGELAQSCGCTVEALREINKAKNDMLRRGQRVYLPYMECAGGFFYKLREGQSFYGIAANTGITLEELVAVNPGIDLSACVVGQVIVLPMHLAVKKPQTTQLRIRKGDTLMKVLWRSGHTIALLQTLNPGIPLNQLYIGQRLIVIDFKKVTVPGKYVLKQGDKLSEIAERFGVSEQSIRLANPSLGSQEYRPGIEIWLPISTV